MSETLQQLEQAISEALNQGSFAISGADVNSQDITNLFVSQFGSDSLQLSGAQIPSALVVTGTLSTAYFALTGVTATFSLGASEPEVSIAFTLPETWTPATSFPELAGSVFEAFQYSDVLLTLTSENASALPADFPGAYGFPGATAQPASACLSMSAQLSTDDPIIGWIVGSPATWSGPIGITAAGPSILLTSPAGPQLTMAGYSVAFTFTLAGFATPLAPGEIGFVPLSCRRASGTFSNDTFTIPVVSQSYSGLPGSLLTVTAETAQATTIQIGQIPALLGLPSSTSIPALPQNVQDATLSLQSISATFSPAAKSLVSVSATIALQTGGWSILEDLITFDSLVATFTWLPGIGAVTAGIACTAEIAGATFTAGINLPDLSYYCVLDPASAPSIASFIQAFDPSFNENLGTITALELRGSITARSFMFEAGVSENWTVPFTSSASLTINSLGLIMSYQSISPEMSLVSGQFSGMATLAGCDVFVAVAYQGGSFTFTGGTLPGQSIPMGTLVQDIENVFGITASDTPPDLNVTQILVGFTVPSLEVVISAATSFTIFGQSGVFGVAFTNSGGTNVDLYLQFGVQVFKAVYQSTTTTTSIIGTWTGTPENGLDVAAVLMHLGLDLSNLPPGILPTVVSAKAGYSTVSSGAGSSGSTFVFTAETAGGDGFSLAVLSSGNNPYVVVLIVDIGETIDLADLPVVGNFAPADETLTIDDIFVAVCSTTLTVPQVAQINALIGNDGPSLEPGVVPAVLQVTLTVAIGGDEQTVVLAGNEPGDGTNALAASGSGAPGSTQWVTIEQAVGPVTIQQVGIAYADGNLTCLVDASLDVADLTISLLGLSVTTPLSPFQPQFAISGMGVDYSDPPALTIGGALTLNTPPPEGLELDYEGMLTVAVKKFAFSALGAYMRTTSGYTSFVAFLQIPSPIRGIPQLNITSLAGGFGFNSQITIPAQNQVNEFPFIEVLSDAGALGANPPTPASILSTLTTGPSPWLTEVVGEKWIAGGCTYTAFYLVYGTCLYFVQFGQQFTLGMLGTATATIPPNENPYAEIQVDFESLYQPSQGSFIWTAVLSPNSYLLNQNCVLVGGMAFGIWSNGDFVLTIGGYNPAFSPPPYYPTEVPVGFRWTIDASVTISGGAYFAITPSAIMTGGSLTVMFQSGNFSAWLTVWADFLIDWIPFQYDATIGVQIGISYKLGAPFANKTITIEIGSQVMLWGPPTGGQVTIDCWIFSFTVPFGQQPPPSQLQPPPASWNEFENTLLPPSNATTTVSPAAGFTGLGTPQPQQQMMPDAATVAQPGGTAWMVHGDAFTFSVSTAVPVSSINGGTLIGSALAIRPMAASGLTSTLSVSLSLVQDGSAVSMSDWTATPANANVPTALWGSGDVSIVPAGEQTIPGLVGASFTVPAPALGSTPGSMSILSALQYDVLPAIGLLPLSSPREPSGPKAYTSELAVAIIAIEIATVAAPLRRDLFAALSELGISPVTNADPELFALEAPSLFIADPLIALS